MTLVMVALLTLSGCSEAIRALALHHCPTPVMVMTIDDVDEIPASTMVPADMATEVWGHCCEPGADGSMTISVGDWQQTFEFDDIRGNEVIEIPNDACEAAAP